MTAGFALDALLNIVHYPILDMVPPENFVVALWLMAIVLVSVPWMVHVIALPMVFRLGRPKVIELALLTALFLMAWAVAIPMLGLPLSMAIGIPSIHVIEMLSRAGVPSAWVNQLLYPLAITIIPATCLGAAVGGMLHLLRYPNALSDAPDGHHPRFPLPRARSDILGGAIAAFIITAGTTAILATGWFARWDWTANTPHPRPPPIPIVIAALALLPHLYMTGTDLRAQRTTVS